MKDHLKHRAVALLLSLALVFGIFSLKLFQLQVVDGESYYDKATSTTLITLPVTAARGEVVDRYGRPIATNRQAYNVRLVKAMLPDESLNDTLVALVRIFTTNGEAWNDAAPLSTTEPYTFDTEREPAVSKMKEKLGLAQYATPQNVYDQMVKRYELEKVPAEYQRALAGLRYQMEYEEYGLVTPFVIASDVSIRTVSQIKEHNLDLPGVDIVEEAIRSYPDPTLMPHILGSIGKIDAEEWKNLYKGQTGYKMNDLVGKSGIEKAYEKQLKGIDGKMTIERTKSGQILSTTVVEEAQPGDTVVLTIDKNLQAAAQKILENQVVELQKRAEANREPGPGGGALVVIDVKTGGVLAAATYPSYDITTYKTAAGYAQYASDEMLPLFNRAFNGLYRPGSTFKVAVATDGLMTGTVDANYTLRCGGVYTFWSDYQPKCTHVHGNENAADALRDSCNVYFYDLGRRLGVDSFNKVAETLGFGSKTGLEISEAAGNLSTEEYFNANHKDERWQKGNVIQAAIGQMDTQVTPVQLATYACSVANKGDRLRTHLVDGIRTYNFDELLQKTEPEVVAKLDADPAALSSAFATVEEGMLKASRSGTATQFLGNYVYNIASKTGTSQNAKGFYDATIVAYGPTEEPELAIGAVVESAGNGYQLARMVRDIFDEYYAGKNQNTEIASAGVLLG